MAALLAAALLAGCAAPLGADGDLADEGPALRVRAGQLTGRTLAGDPATDTDDEAELLSSLRRRVGDELPGLAALLVVDDLDDSGGYAHRLDPEQGDPAGWIVVVISPGPGPEREQIAAHEYGHIVTLGELPEEETAADCDTLPLYGHCPPPGSLLRDFVDTFWTGRLRTIYLDVRERYDELDPEGEQELIDRLGADPALRRLFVTEAARVDPLEDLAETYAVLVCGRDPEGTARSDWGRPKIDWLATVLANRGACPAGPGPQRRR